MTTDFPGPSNRAASIEPFHVMDILARAKQMDEQGFDVVHMEVGEPDFCTDQRIIDAAIQSLQAQQTHYTAAIGLTQLRSKIADYYFRHLKCPVDFNRIVITPGASGAIQLVLAAILEAGDEVIVSDPGYPCNNHLIQLLQGTVVKVPLDAKSDYAIDLAAIKNKISPKTRAIMLASPANPSGAIIDKSTLQQLISLCEEHQIHLIIDEIYQGIQYDTTPFSVASLSDQVWVINSFSKYFGMTGFRVGWLVAPEKLVDTIDRLAQNLFLASPTTAQWAALRALDDELIEEHNKRVKRFQKRRDYLFNELERLGFKMSKPPQGAFYIYADCSPFSNDSAAFARQLLELAQVAVTPGKDFSTQNSDHLIRFAYTTNLERLKLGIRRIEQFIVNLS